MEQKHPRLMEKLTPFKARTRSSPTLYILYRSFTCITGSDKLLSFTKNSFTAIRHMITTRYWGV